MILYSGDAVSTAQHGQTCSMCDVAAALARTSILSDSAADVVTCTEICTAVRYRQYKDITYKKKSLCALECRERVLS
jgi:hypothetical protein